MGAGRQRAASVNCRRAIWQATASLSYVTGAHAFKVGFANTWIERET